MANKTVNTETMLNDLRDIAAQYRAASTVDKDTATLGRQCNLLSSVLTNPDKVALLTKQGFDTEGIFEVSNTLAEWSTALNPQAQVLHDKDTVNAQLTLLEQMVTLGMLDDATGDELQQIRADIKVRPAGGVRAPREAQEEIEGRPASVESFYETVRFSKQKANTKTSVSNVKNRALSFVAKTAFDGDTSKVPTEMADGIEAAVKEVIEDGQAEASFGGITFKVSE